MELLLVTSLQHRIFPPAVQAIAVCPALDGGLRTALTTRTPSDCGAGDNDEGEP